jgi:hypothetical protein
MNKRALTIGFIYCAVAIIFKLIILLGGYTLTRFGFYYSNIVGVFAIIPFFMIAIYMVREKDFGGVISGKDAMRMALTVLAVATIVMSVYNYIEFNWKYKEIATEYYNSPEYHKVLEEIKAKNPGKVTQPLPEIIKAQIADLSAGKATTGKLFPLVLLGLSGAFVTAMFMKRGQKINLN